MENGHRISTLNAICTFVLAGAARFTIRNNNTGGRLTYKVKQARKDESTPNKARPYFVSVLTGANNEEDYSYLGCIWPNEDGPHYIHGKKSRIGKDAKSARGFEWLMRQLFEKGSLPECVEFWHEGKCGCCGRPLTVPESIELGLGPICADKV